MFIPYGGEMDFTYMPCWFRLYQKLHLRVKSITEAQYYGRIEKEGNSVILFNFAVND